MVKLGLFFLTLLFQVAQSHRYRSNFLGPSNGYSLLEKSSVNGKWPNLDKKPSDLTRLVREDLNSKVDEVVDMIASDLEAELAKGGLNNLSLIQQGFVNGMGGTVKEAIKNTLVAVLKSLVPAFEAWIHHSVQPPVVDKQVYALLVHPIGFAITEELHKKLHLTSPNPWKDDDLFDDEEEEDEEA